MKVRGLFLAVLLVVALPAAADRPVLAEAYEVAASDLRLPRSAGGTIALRECDSCNYRVLRVAPDASFVVNGQPLQLDDFRVLLSQLEDAGSKAVTVVHHLESNNVTSVLVTLRR